MADLQSKYNAIASRMTKLVQSIINGKGLVDSGKLVNSTRFEAIKKNEFDYSLQLISQDYFKYLDGRYGIMKAFYASSEYKRIVDDIVKIEADYLIDGFSKVKL